MLCEHHLKHYKNRKCEHTQCTYFIFKYFYAEHALLKSETGSYNKKSYQRQRENLDVHRGDLRQMIQWRLILLTNWVKKSLNTAQRLRRVRVNLWKMRMTLSGWVEEAQRITGYNIRSYNKFLMLNSQILLVGYSKSLTSSLMNLHSKKLMPMPSLQNLLGITWLERQYCYQKGYQFYWRTIIYLTRRARVQ